MWAIVENFDWFDEDGSTSDIQYTYRWRWVARFHRWLMEQTCQNPHYTFRVIKIPKG